MSLDEKFHAQRALIFQGGGALGAYEAGVFRTLYDGFLEQEGESSLQKNLFNIIAGSSIGAINATILVNYFVNNNKSWIGSADALEKFWDKLKSLTIADSESHLLKHYWNGYWNFWHNIISDKVASPEAARRYWSWNQLANTPLGFTRNLCFTVPRFDIKFLDFNPFVSSWLGYDFSQLRIFLENEVHQFPIKTSIEDNEPRLLMVSVDVQDCSTPITFDSYPKPNANADCEWYSEYGKSKDGGIQHRINYNGIGVEQVLASSLFPYSLYHPKMKDESSTGESSERTFWDGNFISSTPLRELLQSHRDFWLDYFKYNNIEYDDGTLKNEDKQKVPDLDVYIVNLYPSIEESLPQDLDSVRDREIDIKFHDRTNYDEQMAHVITDYIDLIKKIRKIAVDHSRDKDLAKSELDNLLMADQSLLSKKRHGYHRTKFQDLLEGRFKVRVHRIDRKDDRDTIFGKHADFSCSTIEQLINAGREDAKYLDL